MKVIKLNVGGQYFETTDEILSKSEYFNILLNGNWKEKKEDIIFIDRDPQIFEKLLKLLRGYQVDITDEIVDEAVYYGINIVTESNQNSYSKIQHHSSGNGLVHLLAINREFDELINYPNKFKQIIDSPQLRHSQSSMTFDLELDNTNYICFRIPRFTSIIDTVYLTFSEPVYEDIFGLIENITINAYNIKLADSCGTMLKAYLLINHNMEYNHIYKYFYPILPIPILTKDNVINSDRTNIDIKIKLKKIIKLSLITCGLMLDNDMRTNLYNIEFQHKHPIQSYHVLEEEIYSSFTKIRIEGNFILKQIIMVIENKNKVPVRALSQWKLQLNGNTHFDISPAFAEFINKKNLNLTLPDIDEFPFYIHIFNYPLLTDAVCDISTTVSTTIKEGKIKLLLVYTKLTF